MKKRMILALVLVFALLCLACSNDADEGASSSESVSVAETSTVSSAESTSSADETSGGTSTESDTSSDTSTESEASGTTTSAESDTSSETSTGTESSATSSDTSTSSKPAENSESSKPAENSKPTEGSESSDTSSSSGNPNPSQTGHKHEYVKSIGKAETCTEDGYMVYTCSCGDSYKGEVLPATGHFMTESITKEPTKTERGTMRYRCSNRGCDYEETREIYSWNELARLEEERVLYWINKYRAEEGAPTLIMSEKLTELNEVRCEQSLQGGEHEGHNSDDKAKACEAVKVGCFCDYVYHASDGTVVQPHWDPHDSAGQEAWIGWSYWEETVVGDKNAEMQMDARAKYNADAFRASEGHWWYVGGVGEHWKNAIYVGIGIGPQNCFVTVCDYNPDEKGYKHITLDEDGNEHIEWVKD